MSHTKNNAFVLVSDMDVFKVSKFSFQQLAIQICCFRLAVRLANTKNNIITMMLRKIQRCLVCKWEAEVAATFALTPTLCIQSQATATVAAASPIKQYQQPASTIITIAVVAAVAATASTITTVRATIRQPVLAIQQPLIKFILFMMSIP